MPFLLQSQGFVEDKAATTDKSLHLALLLAIGSQFVFECLLSLHYD